MTSAKGLPIASANDPDFSLEQNKLSRIFTEIHYSIKIFKIHFIFIFSLNGIIPGVINFSAICVIYMFVCLCVLVVVLVVCMVGVTT